MVQSQGKFSFPNPNTPTPAPRPNFRYAKIILYLLFPLLCSPPYTPLLASFQTNSIIQSPQKILELIEEKYNSYNTYQAEFKELYDNSLRLGRIFLKKPNLFRITYFVKNKIDYEIYIDQNQLWLFFPKYNLVYQENLANLTPSFLESKNPAFLQIASYFSKYNPNFISSPHPAPLFSPNEKKQFNLLNDSTSFAYHLSLKPKKIEQNLNYFEIWVSQKGSILRSRSTNFKQETINLFFYNIQLNKTMPPNTFSFILPNNAQIFKNLLSKWKSPSLKQ